jgi:hypothetical protein
VAVVAVHFPRVPIHNLFHDHLSFFILTFTKRTATTATTATDIRLVLVEALETSMNPFSFLPFHR